MTSVSVAAIVLGSNGAVLAIRRRDTGAWQIPGGVLEAGESIVEGVLREVYEESGVTISVNRLTGVYRNQRLGVVSLVFLASPTGGTPRDTDESAETRWLTEDDCHRLMVPAFAVRVSDALMGVFDAVPVREHDGTDLL